MNNESYDATTGHDYCHACGRPIDERKPPDVSPAWSRALAVLTVSWLVLLIVLLVVVL